MTVVPDRHVRIGLSGQLPTHIDAPATIQVRLPSAAVFNNDAVVNGDQGRVVFNLPGIFRAGVEVRPVDFLRVELAYVHEFWSNHTELDITPTNVTLSGVTGFPDNFKVAPIVIPRHFQDSDSIRLGGEYGLPIGPYRLDLRAGVALESSAVPPAYESALTIDMDKLELTTGLGFHVGPHWRFDVMYAHVFAETVSPPATAAVPAINPVVGNPTPSLPNQRRVVLRGGRPRGARRQLRVLVSCVRPRQVAPPRRPASARLDCAVPGCFPTLSPSAYLRVAPAMQRPLSDGRHTETASRIEP